MNALSHPMATLIAAQSDQPTCSLHWIGKQLGWDFQKNSNAKLEDFASGLIADHGFPKPLPHRQHGGGISDRVSYPRSQWLRIAVIQWLCDFLPPDESVGLSEEIRQAAAEDMDRAAERLKVVGGTDTANGAA